MSTKTMSTKTKITLSGLALSIAIVIVLLFTTVLNPFTIVKVQSTITQTQNQLVKTISIEELINMSDDDFVKLKEVQIMKMIKDTAKTNNIKPYVFCGLAWHESSKFKFANKKIKDSNGRWSYGLFMIQLETARLYDKEVTEEKLLTPTYNTHLAALIWRKNCLKYGNNIDYVLAAHNAGAVYHNKITNPDFVKQVKTAIGDVVSLYDL
jgi:soluble lytic murein transglycosylase-like protein